MHVAVTSDGPATPGEKPWPKPKDDTIWNSTAALSGSPSNTSDAAGWRRAAGRANTPCPPAVPAVSGGPDPPSSWGLGPLLLSPHLSRDGLPPATTDVTLGRQDGSTEPETATRSHRLPPPNLPTDQKVGVRIPASAPRFPRSAAFPANASTSARAIDGNGDSNVERPTSG